jgi:hypothetical protein
MPNSCPGLKRRSVLAQDVETAAAAYECRKDCTIPWANCVATCELSSGKDCKNKCNCDLFSDPNSPCRKGGGQ